MKLKIWVVWCPLLNSGANNGPAIKTKENIMAYVISSDCTMCGACESACPVEAISAGDGKYVIDAGSCTDCGACEATCPMSAISPA
jgi:ferredoxin